MEEIRHFLIKVDNDIIYSLGERGTGDGGGGAGGVGNGT